MILLNLHLKMLRQCCIMNGMESMHIRWHKREIIKCVGATKSRLSDYFEDNLQCKKKTSLIGNTDERPNLFTTRVCLFPFLDDGFVSSDSTWLLPPGMLLKLIALFASSWCWCWWCWWLDLPRNPVPLLVDNLHFLMPIWILGEGVDQPVHWCLDTLHRHSARYIDRPYGGILPKDINRINSLFY